MAPTTHLRIAHISDLHFAKATYNLSQFFSKRWIGNLNLLFSRKQDYLPERLASLPSLFQELKVDIVLVSGDLSTTSLSEEFGLARSFLKQIEEKNIPVIALPGNHDHYTKSAYKNRLFYQFFNSKFSPKNEGVFAYNLKEHKVAAKPLPHNWWLVALDTALSTPIVSSRGLFSSELEENLKKVLSLIPSDQPILLVNHFPLFPHESPRKTLQRSNALQEVIKNFPNIKMYLHGHTHRHCLADLRANGFPIIMDCGSTTHREKGSWNLLTISPKECAVKVYNWNANENQQTWQSVRDASFLWE
jgi:3',5'-cyclic AMP phosphodiesterase CpdA